MSIDPRKIKWVRGGVENSAKLKNVPETYHFCTTFYPFFYHSGKRFKKKPRGPFDLAGLFVFMANRNYTVYVEAAVSAPLPVQFVWKNSPRGLSTLS